ncbi:nitroreductase [Flammeovirgaceae bacterium SG7u.111]|nr:nitroreductase [Flammeovirgaceae bacterium SG7u.132]WPO38764.1 nitroreductase [Flammeovirgaceae bacterium SG7u.111]
MKESYPFDTDEINQLMRERRSVFPDQFSGEIIPQEIIEQLLENANWAPTHGLTEPWRFFVFSGEGLKKLGEFQSDLYKKLSGDDFDEKKYEKLRYKPLKASHVIAIAMERQESGKIPEIEEIEAVACAVQNIYLSATAYGLGGYWGSGGITYKEEAKGFFGLGENDKLLGFFYLGIPTKKAGGGKRKPIAEKMTWIS